MISTIKTIFKSVVGLGGVHIRLLQLDLQEEKERITRLVVLLAAISVSLLLLLVVLSVLIAWFFWHHSPFYTLIGLASFYLFWVVFFGAKLLLTLNKKTSYSSLSELEKNLSFLRDHSGEKNE